MVADSRWLLNSPPISDSSGSVAQLTGTRTHVRQRVWRTLRQHGQTATSFQILASGYHYWFDPAGRGCVAYHDTGGAWVAAGAPVAASAHVQDVATTFAAAARDQGRRCCFFGTEDQLGDTPGFRRTLMGEQPVWDPTAWEDTLSSSRSLREQLRRARAKGVSSRRLSVKDALGSQRPALDALRDRWLASRPLATMGFLVQPDLFAFARERRFYVAEQHGRICGLLVAVPVYARNGWLFEHLLRAPDAPNGTTDTLVDRAMRDVAADGARYVSMGLSPLSGGVSRWLRVTTSLTRPLYNFAGLRAFKARLRPQRWDPVHLDYPQQAYARQPGALVVILDLLRAFAGTGLLRFGLRSLRRDPRLLSRLLRHIIVPQRRQRLSREL